MELIRQWFNSMRPQNRAARATALHTDDSTKDIFTRIYLERGWGRKLSRKFFSGQGSHDPEIVAPYVQSLTMFLRGFPNPPDVVDLGCGDFNVGRQVRRLCGRYIACDIVPQLIEHNKSAFGHMDVDFRCADIAEEELPDGQAVFIRQVLQHLSNDQIAKVVPKLTKYRYLVLTEHLPDRPGFTPNIDHANGSGVRLNANSGVVLTAPPFGMRVRSANPVCSIRKYGGIVHSIVYELE